MHIAVCALQVSTHILLILIFSREIVLLVDNEYFVILGSEIWKLQSKDPIDLTNGLYDTVQPKGRELGQLTEERFDVPI